VFTVVPKAPNQTSLLELDPPSTASAAPIQHGHRGNSSTINDATMARTDSVRDRMKLQPALYQIGNSAASGTIHSTQSLLEHQNGGGSVGELMIAVGWQVWFLSPASSSNAYIE